MLLRSCENPLVNLGTSQPQCYQGSSQLEWPSLTCFPLNFNQTSFGTDSINSLMNQLALPTHHTLTPNIFILYTFWNVGHLLVLLNAFKGPCPTAKVWAPLCFPWEVWLSEPRPCLHAAIYSPLWQNAFSIMSRVMCSKADPNGITPFSMTELVPYCSATCL